MAEQIRMSRARKGAVFRETALETEYDARISSRLARRLICHIGVSFSRSGWIMRHANEETNKNTDMARDAPRTSLVFI
jgi:hypothetical protein